MKKTAVKNLKGMVLGFAMVVAFAFTATAQSVTNFNITEKMVTDAQEAWGKALVSISETHAKGGDFRKLASEIIDAAYNYQNGSVLFKPTLTTGDQTFRMDKAGALAYFVGGDPNFKNDGGFALKGWTKYAIKNKGIILNGDTAITMGNVHLWDKNGNETIVDKTWGFKMDENGKLRIILHHSSLPYKPAK